MVRHLHHSKRNLDRWFDAIYWPILDLLLWGLTTQWLQSSGKMASHTLMVMLTAIVFWQIVWRANYEVSVNLLEETWTQNVVNLFASPLTLREWVAGLMLLGFFKVWMSLAVGLLASWLLYALDILAVGYLLVPFLGSLVLFGWTLGFLSAALIVRYGRQLQCLAWTLGWAFAPLSAVYYPVSVLPQGLQTVAYALPSTYIFEGMRTVMAQGTIPLQMLVTSLALNLVYLSMALWFFASSFEKRREIGLQCLD